MTASFLTFLVAAVAGLAATFFPALPSTALIWVGALAAAWLGGLSLADAPFLAVFTVITVVASLADNLASAWGTGRYGGSKQAVWGAILGSLAGLAAPPFGLILGPLLGALVAELLQRRPLPEALRSAWGTLVGLLTGMAAKLVLNILLVVYGLWRFWPAA